MLWQKYLRKQILDKCNDITSTLRTALLDDFTIRVKYYHWTRTYRDISSLA